jgi:hypothetical protein
MNTLGIGESCHVVLEAAFLGNHIEAALRGDFVTTFRHQHRHLRAQRAGDADHLDGRRHFQIELDMRQLAQAPHILILDMPAVFAQMHRDAVGAAEVGLDRSPDGIRLVSAAGLPQRRHVINIDTEFDHASCNSMKIFRDCSACPFR